jgi:hypothetical protein
VTREACRFAHDPDNARHHAACTRVRDGSCGPDKDVRHGTGFANLSWGCNLRDYA